MAVRNSIVVTLGISARHVAAGIDPVGHLSLAPAPTGRCRNQPCISRANLIRITLLSSARHTIRLAETEGLPFRQTDAVKLPRCAACRALA
jgi:hypothetical protein